MFCFEVIQIKWGGGGEKVGAGFFLLLGVLGDLGGTLVSIFSLGTTRRPPPPAASRLGNKETNPQVDFPSELNPTSISNSEPSQRESK